MSSIKQSIENAFIGKLSDLQDSLEAAIREKVMSALETKKIDVAQSMFDVQEREMTSTEKGKEERLKAKYDPSDMKEKMIKQYGPEKGKEIYFATIRKQAMK